MEPVKGVVASGVPGGAPAQTGKGRRRKRQRGKHRRSNADGSSVQGQQPSHSQKGAQSAAKPAVVAPGSGPSPAVKNTKTWSMMAQATQPPQQLTQSPNKAAPSTVVPRVIKDPRAASDPVLPVKQSDLVIKQPVQAAPSSDAAGQPPKSNLSRPAPTGPKMQAQNTRSTVAPNKKAPPVQAQFTAPSPRMPARILPIVQGLDTVAKPNNGAEQGTDAPLKQAPLGQQIGGGATGAQRPGAGAQQHSKQNGGGGGSGGGGGGGSPAGDVVAPERVRSAPPDSANTQTKPHIFVPQKQNFAVLNAQPHPRQQRGHPQARQRMATQENVPLRTGTQPFQPAFPATAHNAAPQIESFTGQFSNGGARQPAPPSTMNSNMGPRGQVHYSMQQPMQMGGGSGYQPYNQYGQTYPQQNWQQPSVQNPYSPGYFPRQQAQTNYFPPPQHRESKALNIVDPSTNAPVISARKRSQDTTSPGGDTDKDKVKNELLRKFKEALAAKEAGAKEAAAKESQKNPDTTPRDAPATGEAPNSSPPIQVQSNVHADPIPDDVVVPPESEVTGEAEPKNEDEVKQTEVDVLETQNLESPAIEPIEDSKPEEVEPKTTFVEQSAPLPLEVAVEHEILDVQPEGEGTEHVEAEETPAISEKIDVSPEEASDLPDLEPRDLPDLEKTTEKPEEQQDVVQEIPEDPPAEVIEEHDISITQEEEVVEQPTENKEQQDAVQMDDVYDITPGKIAEAEGGPSANDNVAAEEGPSAKTQDAPHQFGGIELPASSGGIRASLRQKEEHHPSQQSSQASSPNAQPARRIPRTIIRDKDERGILVQDPDDVKHHDIESLLDAKKRFKGLDEDFPANATVFPESYMLSSPASWPEGGDNRRSRPQYGRQDSYQRHDNNRSRRHHRGDNYRMAQEPRHQHFDNLPDIVRKKAEPKLSENRSKNAWVPGKKSNDPMDVIDRKMKAILNKMTPEKEQPLQDQVIVLMKEKCTSRDTFVAAINIIFNKAVSEKHFAKIYTRLCLRISREYAQVQELIDDQEVITNFKRYLLKLTQKKFEEGFRVVIDTENKTQDEIEEIEFKKKSRIDGNIVFIGELFLNNLLSQSVIHKIIQEMYRRRLTEEDLEALCKLMTVVGKRLETAKSRHWIDQYFNKLLEYTGSKSLSPRIKYLIYDVVDLRDNKWIPLRKEEKAQTLEQIRREKQREGLAKGDTKWATASSLDRNKGKSGGRMGRDASSLGGGAYRQGQGGSTTFKRRGDRYSVGSPRAASSRGGSQDVRSVGRAPKTNAWSNKLNMSGGPQQPSRPPHPTGSRQPTRQPSSTGPVRNGVHKQQSPSTQRKTISSEPSSKTQSSQSSGGAWKPRTRSRPSAPPPEDEEKVEADVEPTEKPEPFMKGLLKKFWKEVEKTDNDRAAQKATLDKIRAYRKQESQIDLVFTFLNVFVDTTRLPERDAFTELFACWHTEKIFSWTVIKAGVGLFMSTYEDVLIDVPRLASFAAEFFTMLIQRDIATFAIFLDTFTGIEDDEFTLQSLHTEDNRALDLIVETIKGLKMVKHFPNDRIKQQIGAAGLDLSSFAENPERISDIIQQHNLADIFNT